LKKYLSRVVTPSAFAFVAACRRTAERAAARERKREREREGEEENLGESIIAKVAPPWDTLERGMTRGSAAGNIKLLEITSAYYFNFVDCLTPGNAGYQKLP
jgi:hypothetical protein